MQVLKLYIGCGKWKDPLSKPRPWLMRSSTKVRTILVARRPCGVHGFNILSFFPLGPAVHSTVVIGNMVELEFGNNGLGGSVPVRAAV